MSTYLQGIPDYIPQIQAASPNLQLGMQALKMKQSAYDANKQKLSTLYGSLLNSPMLRDKNIQERDQFFKTIDQDIKKLSGMDLSLEQNVVAGSQLFNQLTDNKNIVKDMAWTRNWQNEQRRFDSLRNCTDPEECDQMWWEGGATALNYRAEEFKNATDAEAMSMGNARAVGAVNLTKMATDIAKKADLNVAIDTLKGNYIFTNKNGKNVQPAIQSLLEGYIGSNPAVKDFMSEQAYVQRKDYVKQGVESGMFQSEEMAERDYFDKTAKTFLDQTKAEQTQINSALDSTTSLLESTKSKLEAGNVPENSPLRKQYQDLLVTQQQLQQSSKVMEGRVADYQAFKNNGFSKSGLRSLDKSIGGAMLGSQLNNLAETLSYKDMESSMEADKFKLEEIRFENEKELLRLKQEGDLLLKKYENDLENGGTTGAVEANNAIISVDPDATQIGDDPLAALEQVTDVISENDNTIKGAASKISDRVVEQSFNTLVQSNVADADKTVAKERIVGILDNVMELYGDANNIENPNVTGGFTQYVSLDPSALGGSEKASAAQLSADWGNMTREQKLERVRSIGKDGVHSMIQNLSANGYDKLFNTFTDKLAPGENRSSFYSKIGNDPEILSAIALGKESQNAAIAFEEWVGNQRSSVIDKVKSGFNDTKADPQMAEYLNAAVDENGTVVPIDKYLRNFLQNKRDEGRLGGSMDTRRREMAEAIAAYAGVELPPEGKAQLNPLKAANWATATEAVKNAVVERLGLDPAVAYVTNISSFFGNDKLKELQQQWKDSYMTETGALKGMMESEDYKNLAELIMETPDLDSPAVSDGIAALAATYKNYVGDKETEGIASKWKQSFNDYATLDENAMLKGLGSAAGKKITYKYVDGAAPASVGFQAFRDFSNNITKIIDEDSKAVVFDVDGETSEAAQYIYKQLMNDLAIRNNPKDKTRPIVNYSYLNTTKGREDSDKDWTKMHVEVNAAWVKQYAKDAKDGGIKAFFKLTDDDIEKIVQNGFDVFLDKDLADNKLKSIMSTTALQRAFDFNGSIPAYNDPDLGTTLNLVKGKNNQIILKGQMATGYDPETNKYIYKDIYSPIDNQTGGLDLSNYLTELQQQVELLQNDVQKSING